MQTSRGLGRGASCAVMVGRPNRRSRGSVRLRIANAARPARRPMASSRRPKRRGGTLNGAFGPIGPRSGKRPRQNARCCASLTPFQTRGGPRVSAAGPRQRCALSHGLSMVRPSAHSGCRRARGLESDESKTSISAKADASGIGCREASRWFRRRPSAAPPPVRRPVDAEEGSRAGGPHPRPRRRPARPAPPHGRRKPHRRLLPAHSSCRSALRCGSVTHVRGGATGQGARRGARRLDTVCGDDTMPVMRASVSA